MKDNPRCHKCGTVMVERFEYKQWSEDVTYAIPLGVYDCLKCVKPEQPPSDDAVARAAANSHRPSTRD